MILKPRALVWLGFLLAFPAVVLSQAPVKSNGALTGVVVDASTAAPLADVLVYLSSFGRSTVQKRTLTDAKGRFAFTDLPPSTTYTVAASKADYLDGGFLPNGGPGGPLTNVSLRESEWLQNVNIAMSRPGSVAGTVTDEHGDPVVGVLVRVIQRIALAGREALAAGAVTATDDRGFYRLGGLLPGRYLVQVPSVQTSTPLSMPFAPGRSPASALEIDDENRLVLTRYPPPPPHRDGRAMAYPPSFYPGATAIAQASVIDLKYGEERAGIDIRLEPAVTARVSGRAQGIPGNAGRVRLRLMPVGMESLGLGSEVATVLSEADGRFTFLNVPAGTYTVDATQTTSELSTNLNAFPSGNVPTIPLAPGLGGSRMGMNIDGAPPGTQFITTMGNAQSATYYGRGSVTVAAQDVSNVLVNMRDAGLMNGRIVLEPDPTQPAPATPPRITIQLDPASGDPRLGIPRSSIQMERTTDEFEIQGLLPGEYWLRASSGWVVKSVNWKGRDYTVAPFDAASTQEFSGVVVTATNAVPTLSGTVRDRNGPAVGAAVMIFPIERAQWTNFGLMPARIKSTVSGLSGVFSISSLPAGEYWAIAMSTRPEGWRDAAFFEAAASLATRVTLSWGAPASADLTVTTLGAAR